MRRTLAGIIIAAAALSGCYHVTVISSAQPSATTVEKPWQHSFISGLVPPAELSTKEQCPSGVAKVETQQSFVNLVASWVTSGIYSPIAVKVTCAAR
jgi:hypothetical protein